MRRFVFSTRFAPLSAAVAAALLAGSLSLHAQAAGTNPDGSQSESVTLSTGKQAKKRKGDEPKESKKDQKVQQSKDTKAAEKKRLKRNPLADVDKNLPDKQLYDKALEALNKGHFDVARLDLQTMLNTYPDSQYQMRAKLAVADSWYKEGGSAALAQAEAEYKDFITFFPNVPEAAEAQMRVGDIYFRQMDKPDRDYTKAMHAQEEYRNMIQQFPQSTLVPQAKQRLREVQEVLATRESEVALFYASHENWAAAIARYQTVADTYPLYSGMDQVLIGIGDGYAAQARFVRGANLPEGPKAKLEQEFDDRAMAAYTKAVTEHSASNHVEDARDRIAALNRPQPEATQEQTAASQALENSRSQYKLLDIAKIMFLRRPDVVQTATVGEPTMADPRPTLAPEVAKFVEDSFREALNPGASAAAAPKAVKAAPEAAASETPAAAQPGAPAAPATPLGFNDINNPADGSAPNSGAVNMTTPAAAPAAGATGTGVGLEIVTPKAGETPRTYGLKAVGGAENNQAVPPVEKPAAAEDTVNDIAPGQKTPAAQQAPANGKKAAKPSIDKSEESSSKNKKKKGLGKINPF
ncbi:outer membrane protein assembly factor BamD [Terriglobus albidus]|uniref:Outer membrane protein assembly factor BamD n=1 Tax=Terriglobus albidus TaxID=1592106 RepID=A0A5B9EBC9_9BACT|nr:outer membrane protein assembly factor BamD [Terriglobus albidus]QEE27326.1 outer membrane protein assembly factor BamD [Terriglobus albidus]